MHNNVKYPAPVVPSQIKIDGKRRIYSHKLWQFFNFQSISLAARAYNMEIIIYIGVCRVCIHHI